MIELNKEECINSISNIINESIEKVFNKSLDDIKKRLKANTKESFISALVIDYLYNEIGFNIRDIGLIVNKNYTTVWASLNYFSKYKDSTYNGSNSSEVIKGSKTKENRFDEYDLYRPYFYNHIKTFAIKAYKNKLKCKKTK